MLTAAWSATSGWAAPEIKPYGPLSLSPAASVLHYATECFEGMKAYRGYDGKLRIFRPERNCARMLKSATRISLPAFDPAELQTLVERFVGVEGSKWLPNTEEWRGKFLYLRPTMIATNASIGVAKPDEALLYIIAVGFPPLDEGGPPAAPSAKPETNGNAFPSKTLAKPRVPGMTLLASSASTIRAWPGGFGNAKVGANYGPSLMAQQEARERGYQQILWLFSEAGYVTEAGASNFFVVWKTAEGKTQLVTAPLGDGIILEGVTRQSVLDLVRAEMKEVEVVERKFTMDEVVGKWREGRLVEAFGSGTAYFIAPCDEIHYRGVDVVLPEGRDLAMRVKERMRSIMFGGEQHAWGVVVEEE
jgi:branched-chain amino acid aminotransferase